MTDDRPPTQKCCWCDAPATKWIGIADPGHPKRPYCEMHAERYRLMVVMAGQGFSEAECNRVMEAK